MTVGHGGNLRELARRAGCSPEDILDFSANINPLGPPKSLTPAVNRTVDSVLHYPHPRAEGLLEAVSDAWQLPHETLVAGNGSTELIYALPRALQVSKAVIPVPCYSDYIDACELAGLAVNTLTLFPENQFALDFDTLERTIEGGEIVFAGRPNNPTGISFDAERFREFAQAHPDTFFVVDEAFIDFLEEAASLVSNMPRNTVVLRSLTKFFAIPGVRLGLAVAPPEIAESLRRQIPPWSVNAFAQAIGIDTVRDETYAQETRRYVTEQRNTLMDKLRSLHGLRVFPGKANYLLVELDEQYPDAPALADKLLKEYLIAIRVCDNYLGLNKRYFRVAVRTEEENAKLFAALRNVLEPSAPVTFPGKRQKPAIMFQGTGSSAGKSILATAMCRILLQDGLRVAPFKSQNMSLNSFVTRDGLEMGRAQVTQAQACRLEPDMRMNPILLKPDSDTGSQVIIKGKPVGNMRVGEYINYKTTGFEAAKECYDSLAAEHDAMVLEGAGSPGEVNLREHDIVNMTMAAYAHAPVLLTGDIDRGGVFASFVGTMNVLTPRERAMTAGFVINKFRGEPELLSSAIEITKQHTGKDTFGIIPYVQDLGLPEEDSVEFKDNRLYTEKRNEDQILEIAVIDLPHISNFTDLDALRIEPDVYLTIARKPEDIARPDAIIIPGSKNTPEDLQFLHQSGLSAKLRKVAETETTEIVGVCGGYQILGNTLVTTDTSTGNTTTLDGLGLLPLTTEFASEKNLTLRTVTHLPSKSEVRGYEIHHGLTKATSGQAIFDNDADIGLANDQQHIWGTYLHGVFDADPFRRWWLDELRKRQGAQPLETVQAVYDIQDALDRLADTVRDALDMDRVYKAMGL